MLFDHLHDERLALIVSDDAAFGRSIEKRWHQEASAPKFRMLSSDACIAAGGHSEEFQFVLIGGLHPDAFAEVLTSLRTADAPVIAIGAEGGMLEVAERHPTRILVLPIRQGWQDVLIVVAGEAVRRSEAQARARRAEMAHAALRCEASLGQYVIDVRHNLNNALTSVLGNAELLLLNENRVSAVERSQIDTIRVMALRMHETLQRFSSLEKELRASDARSTQEARKITEEAGRRLLAHAAGAD